MDAVSRLLAELVSIPSVNPMGRPHEPSYHFESALTAFLEEWFRALGVVCERHNVAPNRDNLVARYESPGARSTLLFDVHQDTVPADGMTIDPFAASISEGRLYGRGACDVKGAMAAVLMAFSRLVHERPAGAASVVMVCTVDEEFTHKGSLLAAHSKLGADLAIVAEPTLLQIVNCHKGAVRWKVRTEGVACHSSTPQLGDNAIYRMGDVIAALKDHASELANDAPHPALGPPSLSVGRIEGGQSVNVVPDWCEIEVDRRLVPGETQRDALTRIKEFVRARLGRLDRVEFQPPFVAMPPLSPELVAKTNWTDVVSSAIARVTGKRPVVMGVPYGTDAGPLAEAGLPCLVIGPGDIAQAHTKDEWIDLDQVRWLPKYISRSPSRPARDERPVRRCSEGR